MIYGLILAGGKGSRLYPLSRVNKPKQFLDIIDNKTLLKCTINRACSIIDSQNIYIVTNNEYRDKLVCECSDSISEENIIVEPLNKETAVCISLAAVKLLKKDKDAIIFVFPSDHYIDSSHNFLNVANCALEFANKKRGLVTIGIKPIEPKTGYGYIQIGDPIKNSYNLNNINSYKVERFIEKPSYEIAKDFILNGNYFWNSGMFCFRADVYLRELEKYLPKIYKGMMQIYKSLGEKDENLVINNIYRQLDGISIDFGIMQKTRKAYVISGNFVWDDIGSFTSLVRILEKRGNNFIKGNVLSEDSENCLVFGDKNLTIIFGVKDLIVVNTSDVILIIDKNREQEVKYLFELLKNNEKFNEFI